MPKQKVGRLFEKSNNGLTLFPGLVSDLTRPINFKLDDADQPEQSTAFGVEGSKIKKLLDVAESKETGKMAGVRCYVLDLNPHCHATHTENIGHFHKELTTIRETAADLKSNVLRAALITVVPVQCMENPLSLHPHAKIGDFIITRESLERALKSLPKVFAKPVNSLIVRCDHKDFLDTPFQKFNNPPYFSTDAISYIVGEFCDVGQEAQGAEKVNIKHLLSNLPSIDPESDQGTLLCHTKFFGATDDRKGYLARGEHDRVIQPKKRTNTEMLHLTRENPDGCYFLELNVLKSNLEHGLSLPVLSEVRMMQRGYDDFKEELEHSSSVSVRRPC